MPREENYQLYTFIVLLSHWKRKQPIRTCDTEKLSLNERYYFLLLNLSSSFIGKIYNTPNAHLRDPRIFCPAPFFGPASIFCYYNLFRESNVAENGKQELERPDRLWFSVRGTPLKVNSRHGSTVFVHYSNAKQVNFNQRSAPLRRQTHQPEYLHPILLCFIKVITAPREGIQNQKVWMSGSCFKGFVVQDSGKFIDR